jgi:hypothetical protein
MSAPWPIWEAKVHWLHENVNRGVNYCAQLQGQRSRRKRDIADDEMADSGAPGTPGTPGASLLSQKFAVKQLWMSIQSTSHFTSEILILAQCVSSTTTNYSICGFQLKSNVKQGSTFVHCRFQLTSSLPRVSFDTNPSVAAVLKAIAGDDEYLDPLYHSQFTYSGYS